MREFCFHICPAFCAMKFAFCLIVPESCVVKKIAKNKLWFSLPAKFYRHVFLLGEFCMWVKILSSDFNPEFTKNGKNQP